MLSLLTSVFFVLVWLAVAPPAAARLAKNIAEEKIGESLLALIDRKYHGTKLAYLVRCPLCLSHWILALFSAACFEGWAALPFHWWTQTMIATLSTVAAAEITQRFWLSK